jgi:hypothetical protein
MFVGIFGVRIENGAGCSGSLVEEVTVGQALYCF